MVLLSETAIWQYFKAPILCDNHGGEYFGKHSRLRKNSAGKGIIIMDRVQCSSSSLKHVTSQLTDNIFFSANPLQHDEEQSINKERAEVETRLRASIAEVRGLIIRTKRGQAAAALAEVDALQEEVCIVRFSTAM
jgi:hypothetical protein